MVKSVVKADERGIPTLYVDGKPFFAYSGEIHNSGASSLAFMKEKVWPRLRDLNMNSVIVPVYWELLEPAEGQYDFTQVDGLITQAREENMRLMFLWFGLWKNAESMYVPAWMKRDTETYFRVRKANGEPINTISPFCGAAVEKDKAAFTALMRHLRACDEENATVIVCQVENEIGVLGTERDYGPCAEEAFSSEVPAVVREACHVSGTWREAFGTDAEESFMAYAFASAVEKIASAGQKEYPLPCYTNAWLRQYPWYPGSYPCGGPVKNVHAIWKAVAPSLFTLAPDVYVPYCADVMDEYAYNGNPLFVPEIRKDAVASSYCLYAFGAKNAICFSPFGVEDLALDPDKLEQPPMEVMVALNIDPSAFNTTGSKEYLRDTYGLMKQLEPLYLKYRGTEHLKCFVRHGENDYGTFLRFSGYDLSVSYAPRAAAKPLGAGIVLELAENKFLILGMMCGLSFRPKPGENKKAEFLRLEEGTLEAGEWMPGRILNGDEKMAVKLSDGPQCYMVELFKF
ncbi:MAG: DUF5597 domain-containing protein [Oscillibacter sp.]|nr:DUF5597 domain-containing protein [Oscillibacter sp.]